MNTTRAQSRSANWAMHGPEWVVITVLGIVGSIFFGVLATTANPLLIAMGLGLFVGTFLLMAPRLVVWLVLAFSLPTGALISLANPAFAKLTWVISILSFLLWPMAIAQLARQKRVPWFCWLALLYVAVAASSTLLNWYSIGEFAAGFKRYFQAYGLFLGLAALGFSAKDVDRWKKFFLAMALLQLPFALYEFLVLMPQRGGLEAGSEASDVVAGTFNANLKGGSSSAEMAAFLLIAAAFLTMHWRQKQLDTKRFVLLLLVCLAPLGLGETKIVIILVPLMALILFRKEIMKAPLRNLPRLFIIGLLTAGFAYFYAVVISNTTFADMYKVTSDYNLGSRGYGDNILNRTTVLTFWWSHHGLNEPIGFFFGHGLGSSFWTETSPVVGHVAVRFPHYGIDLTSASAMLWDIGMIGLILYIGILITAWFAGNRILRQAKDPAIHADVLAIQSALVVFIIYIFYGNSSINLLPFQVIIAVVLGYLAYLYKQTVAAAAIRHDEKSFSPYVERL